MNPEQGALRVRLEETERQITTEANPARRVELSRSASTWKLAAAKHEPHLDEAEAAFKKIVKG